MKLLEQRVHELVGGSTEPPPPPPLDNVVGSKRLRSGRVKVGRVTPIFKEGEKEDLNNNRPITVLPTIARSFAKLVYEQLYSYLVDNGLLGNQQWGFRSLHSTVLALNKSTDSWLLSMDRGQLNSVVFLDIKKAFDTVNHDILIKKLDRYGISNNELCIFVSYLSQRT